MTIGAFDKKMSVGECDYSIALTQTIIGKDSIWNVSDIHEGIAKKSGFLLYSSPA